MTYTIAGVVIPDSALAREATELVGAATDDLLFNHSRRAYRRWSPARPGARSRPAVCGGDVPRFGPDSRGA